MVLFWSLPSFFVHNNKHSVDVYRYPHIKDKSYIQFSIEIYWHPIEVYGYKFNHIYIANFKVNSIAIILKTVIELYIPIPIRPEWVTKKPTFLKKIITLTTTTNRHDQAPCHNFVRLVFLLSIKIVLLTHQLRLPSTFYFMHTYLNIINKTGGSRRQIIKHSCTLEGKKIKFTLDVCFTSFEKVLIH